MTPPFVTGSPNIHKPCHLVVNCLIFYIVAHLSRELTRLHHEAYPLDPAAIAALSRYRTSGLNRFGRYLLDVTRLPEPLEYDLPIFSTASQ
jgi:Tn3 transposase DDE domain